MKKLQILFTLAALNALITVSGITALAQEDDPTPNFPPCLPGVYDTAPDNCSLIGPAKYLTDMAEMGITFPLKPISFQKPSPELISVPFSYGRVTSAPAPVYPSKEDAISGTNIKRYIEGGFDYVSYIDVDVVDGKKYYMIDFGEWMDSGDISGGVVATDFQGVTFTSTPDYSFGWILFPVESQKSPSYNAAYTGKTYDRWEMIRVYQKLEAEETNWYLIGPDEWLDARNISVVFPDTAPPEGVDKDRWIKINLYEQTIEVYDQNTLVFASIISTGVPGFWTRPGLFQIYEKLEKTPMTGTFEADRSDYYYLEDVPWTMYFDEKRALHGAYWHTKLGYVQSHGCVNLSIGDARWLYDWASTGDWVYVWDPSGETPVDPDLYSTNGGY
ncbi:MAG: L,D-transpeptidase [Anaerolineales bacterium]|nr:L,D-transpeptidase [Anaerolineales bacterium]